MLFQATPSHQTGIPVSMMARPMPVSMGACTTGNTSSAAHTSRKKMGSDMWTYTHTRVYAEMSSFYTTARHSTPTV